MIKSNISTLFFKFLKLVAAFFNLSISNLSRSEFKLAKWTVLANFDVSTRVHFLNLLLLINYSNLKSKFLLFPFPPEDFGSGKYSLIYIIVFFINPIIKRIIDKESINFFNYFFNSKLFLVCFLQFFFVKSSKNFFSVKITNNICPRHSAFKSF